MTLIYIISSIFRIVLNTILVINNFITKIKKTNLDKNKNIKKLIIKISLFLLFYLFINLYLFPTYANCYAGGYAGVVAWKDADLNLFDWENSTYKGSKVIYKDYKGFIIEEGWEKFENKAKIVAYAMIATGTLMWIYILLFEK